MTRIYYKSDFDFILRLRDREDPSKRVPFPDCDWDAVFWTGSKAHTYRASCNEGTYTNCFREEDGTIHFVFDNHRMGPGILKWEPHFRFPNSIYPDSIRDTFRTANLDIELISDDSDTDSGNIPETEVYIPAVYLTAYDLAVRNGYKGSYEEYVEYVNRFPEVVETSENVNALLSDLADGKALIADALTRQGASTSSAESMQSMADKVLGLQLAVEGDPQYVEHVSRLGRHDLYNVMRNHQKAEYPYMYAVAFSSDRVALKGADAYLCSDGFFTEAEGEHVIAAEPEHYVIYYFRQEEFTVSLTATNDIREICVFNGMPIMPVSNHGYIRDIEVYGDKGITRSGNAEAQTYYCRELATVCWQSLAEITGGLQLARDCEQLVVMSLSGLERITGGIVAFSCGKLSVLTLPALKDISGASDIAYNCAALTTVHVPALEKASGWLLDSCHALKEFDAPSLKILTGGAIIQSCNNIATLSLPALETITGGTVANGCAALTEISLPALKKIRSSVYEGNPSMSLISTSQQRFDLYMDSVEEIYTSGDHTYIVGYSPGEVHLHMPKVINAGFFNGLNVKAIHSHTGMNCKSSSICAYPNGRATTIYFHIAEGAITALDNRLDRATMDADNMREVISRLGDNNGNPAVTLSFGSTAIKKLSQEDIALAVSKNYTLL